MEQLIIKARPYLEVLYFFSGIIVAIAAVFALRQIHLLKMDMMARSERAAKEKAIDAVHEFVNLGVLYCKCTQLYEKGTERTYRGGIGDFSLKSIPVEFKEMSEKRFENRAMGQPLNLLDVIAATFITGVADEKTAFPIFGGAFCAAVAGQYDFICMARSASKYEPYSNTIELYKTWSSRLTIIDLQKERDNLDKLIAIYPEREHPPLSPIQKGHSI